MTNIPQTQTAQAGQSGVPLKITAPALSNLAGTSDDCGGVSVSGTVTATGATDDGGGKDSFVVTLFDDGIQKGIATFTVNVGQTASFNFSFLFPGPVLTGAPGVGIEVRESAGGAPITQVDPFFPTPISGCVIGQSTNVPTLSAWGLGATGALLALLGGWFGFSRRKPA